MAQNPLSISPKISEGKIDIARKGSPKFMAVTFRRILAGNRWRTRWPTGRSEERHFHRRRTLPNSPSSADRSSPAPKMKKKGQPKRSEDDENNGNQREGTKQGRRRFTYTVSPPCSSDQGRLPPVHAAASRRSRCIGDRRRRVPPEARLNGEHAWGKEETRKRRGRGRWFGG